MSKSYAEKLKDPRWQRKRLEIFQRDNFTCQECGDTISSLQVHHKRYTGPNPWDAPSEDLITLCEDCHESKKRSKSKHRVLYSAPVIDRSPLERYSRLRQVALEYCKKFELSVTSEGMIWLNGCLPCEALENGATAKDMLLAAGWRKVGVSEFEV